MHSPDLRCRSAAGRLVAFLNAVSLLSCTTSCTISSREIRKQEIPQWTVSFTVPAFQWQTVKHEGSHALAAAILDWRVTAFEPYLHNSDGKFYFGRVDIHSEHGKTPWEEILFFGAPTITNTIIFATADLLLKHVVSKPRNIEAVLLFAFGLLAPFVDTTATFLSSGDWNTMRRLAGDNQWTVNAMGASLLALGAWQIWARGRELLAGKKMGYGP